MGRKQDDEAEDALPTTQIDPLAVLDRLAAALEGMKSSPAAEHSELTLRLTEALERVSAAQTDGAKLIASETRRAHRPSNEVVPYRTTLNPRGERDYPRPRLKCRMLIPWLADQDSLTREEIELLNLLEPGEYIVKRSDDMKLRVTVQIKYALDEVTPSSLLMNHETAFNNDNQRWMPPLTLFLRQIHNQSKVEGVKAKAAAVLSMDEEIALIESDKLLVSQ